MIERHSTTRLKEEAGVSGEGERGIEGEGWAEGGECSRSVANEAANESISCMLSGEEGDSSAGSLVDSQPSSDSESECAAKDAESGWILSVAVTAPPARGCPSSGAAPVDDGKVASDAGGDCGLDI